MDRISLRCVSSVGGVLNPITSWFLWPIRYTALVIYHPLTISFQPNNFVSRNLVNCRNNTHTRLTALYPGLPESANTRKVKTNVDFTEARDSEWQWHQLGRMQVCTSLQSDNHANTPPLSFLQAGSPSCCPTNSVKALKAIQLMKQFVQQIHNKWH